MCDLNKVKNCQTARDGSNQLGCSPDAMIVIHCLCKARDHPAAAAYRKVKGQQRVAVTLLLLFIEFKDRYSFRHVEYKLETVCRSE